MDGTKEIGGKKNPIRNKCIMELYLVIILYIFTQAIVIQCVMNTFYHELSLRG